jgi:plasmid rolling circle replication initiator protein Rep
MYIPWVIPCFVQDQSTCLNFLKLPFIKEKTTNFAKMWHHMDSLQYISNISYHELIVVCFKCCPIQLTTFPHTIPTIGFYSFNICINTRLCSPWCKNNRTCPKHVWIGSPSDSIYKTICTAMITMKCSSIQWRVCKLLIRANKNCKWFAYLQNLFNTNQWC